MRRRRSFLRPTGMLLALVAAAARLPSQQRDSSPLIGALPFTNSIVGSERAALDPLVSGVPELLLIELSRNPDVRSVEPARVRRVLASQKRDPQARIDDEAATRIGRILGAQWMILGSFTSDGRGTLRVAASLVNVESGQAEHSASAEGKQANLAGLTGQLAEHLGRDLHLAGLPQDSRRARDLAQKASYETTMAFARAIEARDAGRVQQAIAMLQTLVSGHPEY